MRWRIALVSLVAFAGCAANRRQSNDLAFIDDGQISGTFQIKAVDGTKPNRSSHPVITMVPLVLVEPGNHTFEIQGSDAKFTARVERGRRYMTQWRDDVPTLVEKVDESSPAEIPE